MRGQYTDPPALAERMHRLQHWLDESELAVTTTRRSLDELGASVTVDPESRAPAASLNRNAIRLCPRAALSVADLDHLAESFAAAGVARFFVWLSPGPGFEVARRWLVTREATPVSWTRYPVLIHQGVAPARGDADWHIQPVARGDSRIDSLAPRHSALLAGFRESLGRPGFHHFAALAEGQLIATAALAVQDGLGYLTYAATDEQHRRRGAQSALIAARVRLARELGCDTIACQTLTLLASSYSNLLRAGFVEVYEKAVFEVRSPRQFPTA